MSDYFSASRQARYSLTFALPLWLLYEGLVVLSGSHTATVRNGADVLLKTVFVALGGQAGVSIFGVVLLGVGLWFVWRDSRLNGGHIKPSYLGLMLGESLVYAMVLGTVVSMLTKLVLTGQLAMVQAGGFERMPFDTQLVISLGAGLYEELLFRVLLVSGLVALGGWAGLRRPLAVGIGVVVSAIIFSAFHYVGPFGDPFTITSFAYRAVAGLVLSGLYVVRGFGITAWTHALYDVGIAVML